MVDKDQADRYHSGCFGEIPTLEGEILDRVPAHPHIAHLIGYCVNDSTAFEKFTCLFCQGKSHRSLKMSPHASVVFLGEYSCTLSDYISQKQKVNSLPPYGLDEGRVTVILAQLLLAMAHLDQHGIVMSTITTADLYINDRRLLVAGDFSTCVDLIHQAPEDIKNKLSEMPQSVVLSFPPELCHLCDCSPSEILEGEEGKEQLRELLSKCNVYVAARLIVNLFSLKRPLEDSWDVYPSADHFSQKLNMLMRRLVDSQPERRLSAFEGALCCLVLVFGPKEDEVQCEDDCGKWLLSQALHFFLQPSLKGESPSYSSEQHNKLRYSYLAIANSARIWKAVNFLKSNDIAC